MPTETDLTLPDGRRLHVYDTGGPRAGQAPARLTVFWQHGTPQTGALPEPLLGAGADIRWVSYDRPGYGRSTALPGRTVAAAAADTAAIADALGIGQFAVLGASGGGPHALACAALLPGRVLGAVSVAGPAPYQAAGLDWYAGMADYGAAEFRAAAAGREALESHLRSAAQFDPDLLTPADWAALSGPWSWLAASSAEALRAGLAGMIDDDLACVAPWGFSPEQATAPVLLLHGGQDRVVPGSHAEWLARRCPVAELQVRPDDGHVSILGSGPAALDWLTDRA